MKNRVASNKGKQLGITFEYRKLDNGREYYINFFSEQTQKFVYEHITEIINYRNGGHSQTDDKIPSVDYPMELSVREFVQQNPDKCFIMSIKSCNLTLKNGSYTAVLLYKGKSKVLKKTDISTNSANICILNGILDAVSVIKLPTDVIILSSTSLGFNTPKSKNYGFCQEIYHILTEKGCSFSVSVCQGKGYELNSFVESFG